MNNQPVVNTEQEIKNLREQYNNDVIEKAKCENNLEHLQKKKDEVLEKCGKKGIKPEEISIKKQELTAKRDGLIEKAKGLFNKANNSTVEAPF